MVVDVGMILALFAFFQPVRRWIDASVDAFYASEITKFENLAARLDEASRTTVEVERLLRFIEDLLQRELRLRQVRILIYAAEDGQDSTLVRVLDLPTRRIGYTCRKAGGSLEKFRFQRNWKVYPLNSEPACASLSLRLSRLLRTADCQKGRFCWSENWPSGTRWLRWARWQLR